MLIDHRIDLNVEGIIPFMSISLSYRFVSELQSSQIALSYHLTYALRQLLVLVYDHLNIYMNKMMKCSLQYCFKRGSRATSFFFLFQRLIPQTGIQLLASIAKVKTVGEDYFI